MMKTFILFLSMMADIGMPGQGFAAKTKLEDVWKDKQQHIVVRKVAVFWIARSSQNRLLAENAFVRQLKTRGLIAMPAYVIIPPDRFVERDEVMTKIRELGVDTV